MQEITNKVLADAWLTTSEAAKALGVKNSTIEKWARDGSLPSFKIGGLRRYRASDLRQFIENSRQEKIPPRGKSA
jgi:excisionase family DNA binding protein